MSIFEIPLTPEQQIFTISLAGTVYQLTFQWNSAGQYWVMDIDSATGTPILYGIALLPGIDLLAAYEYLGIGGKLFVATDHDPTAPPTFANLGVTSHLYFEPN